MAVNSFFAAGAAPTSVLCCGLSVRPPGTCVRYTHVDGSSYEGEWRADAKCGQGVEKWTDGARYWGDFVDGKKHGQGVYTSGTGVTFEGQFRNDKMDGDGRYSFIDDRIYLGQWRAGHMHGQGRMEWPSGASYEGQHCGVPHRQALDPGSMGRWGPALYHRKLDDRVPTGTCRAPRTSDRPDCSHS